jgi:hypothetical protein
MKSLPNVVGRVLVALSLVSVSSIPKTHSHNGSDHCSLPLDLPNFIEFHRLTLSDTTAHAAPTPNQLNQMDNPDSSPLETSLTSSTKIGFYSISLSILKVKYVISISWI